MKNRGKPTPRNALFGCMAGGWSLTALTALLLLTVFQRRTNYVCRVDFLLPNFLLLLAGGLGLILCSYVYLRNRDTVDHFAQRHAEKEIRILSAAVFSLQAYLFFNIYFLSGWDVEVVVTVAENIAEGNPLFWHNYFSRYPNNLGITWVLTLLFRINNALGNAAEPVYFVILVQCAASCMAGYLLFQVVKDMTGAASGFGAWLVYILHVAFSPWLTIPYTDAMTLLIPISVLRLYQTAKAGTHPVVKWAAIGFLSAFGYKLKPQCAIILIAIVICEGVGFFGKNAHLASRLKQLGILLTGAAAALTLLGGILLPSLGYEVDKEQTLGPSHFLMMGLNWDTCGVYSDDDVSYSLSIPTASERFTANLQTAKNRVQSLGVAGLVKHLARKCLVNFGDGTYAWGMEGGFYTSVPPVKNQRMSPLLREIFYSTGAYYPYFAVFQQFVWITILLSSAGMALYFATNRENAEVTCVIALALLGLVMFQTIFEARARYFFSYSPLFICAAFLGWTGFIRFLRSRVMRAGKKRG